MWASGTKVTGGGAAGFDSRCKVDRITTGLDIPNAVYTKAEFNHAIYDNLSEFDIVTNHRFVATATGKYHVSATIKMESLGAGKGLSVVFYVNGVQVLGGNSMGAGSVTNAFWCQTDTDLDLTAGDYVETFVYHDAGATKQMTGGACMAVHRFV